jgi:hypothetical protein
MCDTTALARRIATDTQAAATHLMKSKDATRVDAARRHLALREEIDAFWLAPRGREGRTWTDHRDINEVMLATALLPEGFLKLRTPK